MVHNPYAHGVLRSHKDIFKVKIQVTEISAIETYM